MTGARDPSSGGLGRRIAPQLVVTAALLLVFSLVAATGCGLFRTDPAGRDAAGTPRSSGATPSTGAGMPGSPAGGVQDPSADAAPVEQEPQRTRLPLGRPHDRGEGITVTAHAVRTVSQDAHAEPAPGLVVYAVDVEVCMEDVLLSPEYFQSFSVQWTLVTSDPEGPAIDWVAGGHDGDLDGALDLFTTQPAAHTCYRGWVALDGPAGADPVVARVQMSPDVEWSVATG